ncbi:hypothetical protein [Kineosporia sp. NBRC 101731]|uniref:hypothetical protein n=1 Tax=Kineosporia sp. NBRC 101731 TaxID=3032199 RepID=UPI002556808D|nr:hypothetical protein [Kineosporia sp. NBRC 101731]
MDEVDDVVGAVGAVGAADMVGAAGTGTGEVRGTIGVDELVEPVRVAGVGPDVVDVLGLFGLDVMVFLPWIVTGWIAHLSLGLVRRDHRGG